MLRNGHVRFGGRPAETHQFKDWQGAAGRPYTEHRTAWIQAGEGKLYLCAIKDVCSRRIVGYAIDSRMKSSSAVRAINNAVARRRAANVTGCILHSDRVSQFRAKKVTRVLEQHGLIGSMGRVGAAGDCQSLFTGSCEDRGVLAGAF